MTNTTTLWNQTHEKKGEKAKKRNWSNNAIKYENSTLGNDNTTPKRNLPKHHVNHSI